MRDSDVTHMVTVGYAEIDPAVDLYSVTGECTCGWTDTLQANDLNLRTALTMIRLRAADHRPPAAPDHAQVEDHCEQCGVIPYYQQPAEVGTARHCTACGSHPYYHLGPRRR